MFTLKRIWDSFTRLADAIDGFARTLDALSAEVQARCALPGSAPAPALPTPEDAGNGQPALTGKRSKK
jgi:hypothetical protein